MCVFFFFFFSSRRRHTRLQGDWSSDVCSSDLNSKPVETSMEAGSQTRICPLAKVKIRQNICRTHRPSTPHKQRSEEHTSELQSPCNLVCRLLLEEKHGSLVDLTALLDYDRCVS